jgi:RNA polymerase sigma-70 factor (ECF subfamily)
MNRSARLSCLSVPPPITIAGRGSETNVPVRRAMSLLESSGDAAEFVPAVALRVAHASIYHSLPFIPMNNDGTVTGRAVEDLWNEVSALLAEAAHNPDARDRVITLLYPELHRIAEAHMRRERRDHTLQATALVGEFFMHIARAPTFTARTKAQFLMVASVTMRRLLVDYARARTREKRGRGLVRVDIEDVNPSETNRLEQLLAIDELLSKLARDDERGARIVELRFFGGMTGAEIAEALDVTERTVKRDWQVARAWLYSQLRRDGGDVLPGLESD